jgi:hypothetical protein
MNYICRSSCGRKITSFTRVSYLRLARRRGRALLYYLAKKEKP